MSSFASFDMDQAGPSTWHERSDEVPERLNADWYVTAAAALSFDDDDDEQQAASASLASNTDSQAKGKRRADDEYRLMERDLEWELENETFDGRFAFLDQIQPASAPLSLGRRDSTATNAADPDAKVSITHNTPLQLAVAIGSVILFATLAGSLAWMFRTSCGRRRQRRLSRKGNAWSPGATSSVFTDDSDGNKVDAKEWAHQATLPTPLPQLRDATPGEKERRQSWLPPVTRPQPAHHDGPGARPSSTGRGWELFDGPAQVDGSDLGNGAGSRNSQLSSSRGGNYAAAQALAQGGGRIPDVTDMRSSVSACPPRQPTFVARVMAQRAGTGSMLSSVESRGAMLEGQSGSWPRDELDAVVSGALTQSPQPMQQQQPRQQQPRARPSLSARDAFRSVLGLRPAQRNPALDDSDFEGTIGARDRDLPAARRIAKGEPRFSIDDNTTVPNRSPLPPAAVTAEVKEETIVLDEKTLQPPVAVFSMQLADGPTPVLIACTPKTPGIAGVGTAWANGKSELRASLLSSGPLAPNLAAKEAKNLEPRPPVFEDLRRQEALAEMQRQVDAVGNGSASGPATAKLVASITKWIEAARHADPVGWSTPLLRNASASSVLSSLSGSSCAKSAKDGHRSWRADSEQASEIFIMLEKYTMAAGPQPVEPEEGTEIAFGVPPSPGSAAMLPYLAAGKASDDKASVSDFSISLYAKPSMLRKPETAYVADMRLISPKQRVEPVMLDTSSSRRTRHSTSASEYTSLTSLFDDAAPHLEAAAAAAVSKGFAPAPPLPNVVAEVSARDQTWNHQDEVAENAKREIDRRQKTLRKEQRRIAREMAQEQRLAEEEREESKRQAEARASAAAVAAATARAAAKSARRRRSSVAPAKGAASSSKATKTGEGERSRPRKSVSNDVVAAPKASKPSVPSQPAPSKLALPKRDASAPRQPTSRSAPKASSKPRIASAAPRTGILPASGPYPQRRVMSASRRGPTPSPPDSPWTSPSSEVMAAGNARIASGHRREPGSFITERQRSRSAAVRRPSLAAGCRPSNARPNPAPRCVSAAVAPPAPQPETKTTAQLQAEARRASIAGHTLATRPY